MKLPFGRYFEAHSQDDITLDASITNNTHADTNTSRTLNTSRNPGGIPGRSARTQIQTHTWEDIVEPVNLENFEEFANARFNTPRSRAAMDELGVVQEDLIVQEFEHLLREVGLYVCVFVYVHMHMCMYVDELGVVQEDLIDCAGV
jgi:hypothetical protein